MLSFVLDILLLQVFFIITAFFGTGNIASINRHVYYIYELIYVCEWLKCLFLLYFPVLTLHLFIVSSLSSTPLSWEA